MQLLNPGNKKSSIVNSFYCSFVYFRFNLHSVTIVVDGLVTLNFLTVKAAIFSQHIFMNCVPSCMLLLVFSGLKCHILITQSPK